MIRFAAVSSIALAAGVLAGAFVVCATTEASADWPMSRHDARRTAAAPGMSNITSPAPTWRFRTGGLLYPSQALVADANGDGTPEFFFVRGASGVGKRLDDSTIFQTPSIGVLTTSALADLDGDGKTELLVRVGTNQNAVIDGTTGAVHWLQSASDLGWTTGTRVADLNGDGVAEVLLQDCGCCAVIGNIPGAVYSFKGDLNAPKVLWQLPYGSCGGSNSTTVLDADGDGKLEVLMGRTDGFDLLDAATGAIKASINYGYYLQVSQCVPAKITGGPGEQLVCVYANSTSDDSGHRAFAIGFSPSPSPSLTILWDQKLGTVDGSTLLRPGFVADLDGDGVKEVTVTAHTSATAWATYVLDAASGAVLATLDAHKLIGTAPVVAGGRSLILTEETSGVAAWSFARQPTPAIAPRWQLPGQGPLGFYDYALALRASPTQGIVSVDLTGDGTPDLITADANNGTLRVLDTSQDPAAPPPVVGAAAPPPESSLLFSAPTTLGGKPALAVGFSDGVFQLKTLQGGVLADVQPPGVRFDGYYASSYWRAQGGSPVVASLGAGQPDRVLLPDARGIVHVLDAAQADAKTAPKELWSVPKATSPLVIANLDGGAPGVVMIQRQAIASNPLKQQVIALGANGGTLWVHALDGATESDLVAGNIDGDDVPDLIASFSTPADGNATLRTRAISGQSGATLWDGAPLTSSLFTGATLHDWDGDGRDDVFAQVFGVHVLSGANGAEIGPPPAEKAQNALPVVVDGDGDGLPELVLQGGYSRLTVLSSDLAQVLYKSTEEQSTTLYGAIARCPEGARLVEGTAFYHTARITITDLTPPAVGNMTTVFLAGGKAFPDEASATAAGAVMGTLSAVAVHEDLTGLGHPSAVVGSSDGWLYALDPCSVSLDFTYEFKNTVGSVVFGDTDGDGLDEILVTVSDGYLYDLKQKPIDPGTGGAGGTGGSGGIGGTGGTGGATGSGGTIGSGGVGGKPIDEYPITGRATCFCATPGERGGSALGLAVAAAIATTASARRRARRRPL